MPWFIAILFSLLFSGLSTGYGWKNGSPTIKSVSYLRSGRYVPPYQYGNPKGETAILNDLFALKKDHLTLPLNNLISIQPWIDRGYVGQIDDGVKLTALGEKLATIDAENYFVKFPLKEGRLCRSFLDDDLISFLSSTQNIFTAEEMDRLQRMTEVFRERKSAYDGARLKREEERVSLDLVWKSAELEGNTYTILETDNLLELQKTANDRLFAEARMILNHKKALSNLRQKGDALFPLKVDHIVDAHCDLTHDLGIKPLIRCGRVGIGGTSYVPPKTKDRILYGLELFLDAINNQSNFFSKSLLAILLISYLQPFEDGNKRTARMIGSAILLNGDNFPITFMNVPRMRYINALLLFYERNNIGAFKELMLHQAEHTLNNYFLGNDD
jgi:hypothetical protein